MVAGRNIQTKNLVETIPSSVIGNSSVSAKNLRKHDLGGVIFGCKHNTMAECLAKQLFGLPSFHFPYIKNIEPRLPLFLFNYSDRKLHGIFEAASHGQMNIDSYAWTDDGAERSPFPAQVRIHIKMKCNPLAENQFRKIIEDNYYTSVHFWFELDHAQTRGLTALFTSSAVKPTYDPVRPNLPIQYKKPPVGSNWTDLFKEVPSTTSKEANLQECIETETWEPSAPNDGYWDTSSALVDMKQKEPVTDWEELADDTVKDGDDQTLQREQSGVGKDNGVQETLLKLKSLSMSHSKGCINDRAIPSGPKDMHESGVHSSKVPIVFAEHSAASNLYNGDSQLVQVIKELIERTAYLEKQQVEANHEIQQLRGRVQDNERKIQLFEDHLKGQAPSCSGLGSLDYSLNKFVEQCLGSENVIYLIGGFNGSHWLSALDSFSPSLDILTPLKPMSYIRSYASAVALDSNLYVFGGGDGSSWYDSVECYDPRSDEWTSCPNLIHEKGSLAGATLNGKIFAIGGGDGIECFSDVEMFDPALRRWINIQPMLQKRFAPAAAELHGALYAVGGYDGTYYLQSAERFDPREPYWTKLPSMRVRRGCHSLVALNDKLYAMGGYDGDQMVSSVEILDPRMGSWIPCESMNCARGYGAAVVLGDTLFALGGVQDGENIVETVECYREGGSGWAISGLRAFGRRCFCSAVVL